MSAMASRSSSTGTCLGAARLTTSEDDMDPHPYGLSDDLSQADIATMAAAAFDLGHGRSRSVAELVGSWIAHVNRLHAEQYLRPGEDNEAWTAHDYVAA